MCYFINGNEITFEYVYFKYISKTVLLYFYLIVVYKYFTCTRVFFYYYYYLKYLYFYSSRLRKMFSPLRTRPM